MRFNTNHFFLGIPSLLSSWRLLFSPKDLMADLSAGLTVAFVAIPLSLAIALASGFTPAAGLVTAIIAGIVCAMFGGTPLAISGPAAAMSVLIADIVEKFGFPGIIMVCLLSGLMQLLSGMFGLGKLSKYVPLPVIAGFTAGIGFIILISQLPRAFGLKPPSESHVIDIFIHIQTYFNKINMTALVLVVITLIIIRGLPKLSPKAPAILIAVVFTTLIAYIFKLSNIELIGNIPHTLPKPMLPIFPNMAVTDLLVNSFAVFLLASLETLLSASAIDKLTPGQKHDPDQELIGQGLGNVTVSFFGGMPVTNVIARSATNVKAGAKTRRASIIHSFIILLSVFAIAPLIGMIPIAALAAVLFSVAYSMLNYKEFYNFWVTSRTEGFVYGITFLTIVFVDLLAGVQAGILAAAVIMLFQASRPHLHFSIAAHQDNVIRLSITGALTFLSVGKFAKLEGKINESKNGKTIILDLAHITSLDSSGAAAVIDLFKSCELNGFNFYLKGLPRRYEQLMKICGGEELLEQHYLVNENDLRKKENISAPTSSRGRLVHGLLKFYEDRKLNDRRLYEFITSKQDPHTLFITCSDSRVVPSLITSAEPGELFIIRNVGNAIPPYKADRVCSEAAALDFSLSKLDITDVVICGHANCGAIMACRSKNNALSQAFEAWIDMIRAQLEINKKTSTNELARRNVLNQINNLKTYPIVKQRLSDSTLTIHGWFFNFSKSMMYEWDDKKNKFKPIITDDTIETKI